MKKIIDPLLSGQDNLLSLINADNPGINLQMKEVTFEAPVNNPDDPQETNTSVVLTPTAEGRFNVSAGPVTVTRQRIALSEDLNPEAVVLATPETTMEVLHESICEQHRFMKSGTVLSGTIPTGGSIEPGQFFEMDLTPNVEGEFVYKPLVARIRVKWDGKWLTDLLQNTKMNGFAPLIKHVLNPFGTDVTFNSTTGYVNTGANPDEVLPQNLSIVNIIKSPRGDEVLKVSPLTIRKSDTALVGNKWTLNITAYYNQTGQNGDGLLFSRGPAIIRLTTGNWYVRLGSVAQGETIQAPADVAVGQRLMVRLVRDVGKLSFYVNGKLVKAVDVIDEDYPAFGSISSDFGLNYSDWTLTGGGFGNIERYAMANDAVYPVDYQEGRPANLVSLLHFSEPIGDAPVLNDEVASSTWITSPNNECSIVADGVFGNALRSVQVSATNRSYYRRNLTEPERVLLRKAYTIDFWFRNDKAAQNAIWVGNQMQGLIYQENGSLHIRGEGSEPLVPTVPYTVYTDGVKHHFRLTWDGAVVRLFMDGVMIRKATQANPFINTSLYMSIMGHVSGGGLSYPYTVTGEMDEFMFCASCLNTTDDAFEVPVAPW